LSWRTWVFLGTPFTARLCALFRRATGLLGARFFFAVASRPPFTHFFPFPLRHPSFWSLIVTVFYLFFKSVSHAAYRGPLVSRAGIAPLSNPPSFPFFSSRQFGRLQTLFSGGPWQRSFSLSPFTCSLRPPSSFPVAHGRSPQQNSYRDFAYRVRVARPFFSRLSPSPLPLVFAGCFREFRPPSPA